MTNLFELAIRYKELLPLIGATIAAAGASCWTVLQYALTQRRERQKQIFATYHKLIEDLVENGGPNGVPRLDRQCAIVYELRFFKRYRPVTRRMLFGLKATWLSSLGPDSRLIHEIDLTLKAIAKRFWERE